MAFADAIPWLIAAAAYLALVWLVYTEFTYLGRFLTRRLYDAAAGIYERKWRSLPYRSETATRTLFVEPLRQALAGRKDAHLLDLACGSGRISLLVLREDWFHGYIDAIDLSPRMLQRFHDALAGMGDERSVRVSLAAADLARWCAPCDACYDVVALMEASEFIPDLDRLTAEIVRALKPGGLFLLTKVNSSQAWLFFGRPQSTAGIDSLLRKHGLHRIEYLPWRKRHDVVHAWKP